MKPKCEIDSQPANLETETFAFRDRGETFRFRDPETFQKSNLRLPQGETAVSRLPRGETAVSRTTSLY